MIGRVLRYDFTGLRRSWAFPITALFAVGGAVLGRAAMWFDSLLESAQIGGFQLSGDVAGSEIAVPLALLAFVIAAAWVFGRDLSDGGADHVFTAPIRRESIFGGRLLLLFGWVTALSALSLGTDVVMRSVLSLTSVEPGAPLSVGWTLASVASAACGLPVIAWVALRFRSVIMPVGVGIAVHFVAYSTRGFEFGAALPWNAPLEYAVGTMSAGSIAGVIALLLAGVVACIWQIRRLDMV